MEHAIHAFALNLAAALAMAAPFVALIGTVAYVWRRELAAFERDAASVLERQGRGQA